MTKYKDTLAIIIFLILVVLVWAGIALLPKAEIAALPKTESGYSLAICKDVIEQHGGTIEIESEIGKGTIVTFTLPLFAKGVQA